MRRPVYVYVCVCVCVFVCVWCVCVRVCMFLSVCVFPLCMCVCISASACSLTMACTAALAVLELNMRSTMDPFPTAWASWSASTRGLLLESTYIFCACISSRWGGTLRRYTCTSIHSCGCAALPWLLLLKEAGLLLVAALLLKVGSIATSELCCVAALICRARVPTHVK